MFEGDYNSYFRKIFHGSYKSRVPANAIIELGYECNLKCVHCYCPPALTSGKGKPLSYKEICTIIDELVELGCMWVVFTGGEPLMHKHFCDLYIYAKKKGLLVKIYTNATLIDRSIVNMFERYPPFCVEVSYYGYSKEVYERVTQVSGSFERFQKSIRLLLDRKIPMKIKSVALTINVDELAPIAEFARSKNIYFLLNAFIDKRINGDDDTVAYRLPPEQAARIDFSLSTHRSKYMAESSCRATTSYTNDRYKLVYCGMGRNTVVIDPCGKITGCTLIREFSYDIRKSSLRKIWFNYIPRFVLTKRFAKPIACRTCEKRALCDWCTYRAKLDTGDWCSPVEYLCRMADERSKILGSLK